MPTPVPDAIAHAARQLDPGYLFVLEYKQDQKRNEAWYRRNEQVQLWLNAFPFLKGLHCNGCEVIHVSKESPNHCDRCEEFLRQRVADFEFPF